MSASNLPGAVSGTPGVTTREAGRALEGVPWSVAAVAGLAVAVYAPTLVWLWGRWTLSVWHNAHGLLIPVVVVWAIWHEFKHRRDLPWGASKWGFAFLVPALILHAVDTGLHTQLLSAASIVMAVPGLFLLFAGTERTKAVAFPLLFLVFMLPIPLALTERLHLALRHVAASATAAIVPWLGIPVFKEETTLHLATATLQVADACSGFSTLYAAVAVACLTAWTTSGWARRMLVLAAAAPIAIAANIVRVVLLVVLTHAWGVETLEGPMHVGSGLLTFALALPVIFWLGRPAPERR
jgi:exosortase